MVQNGKNGTKRLTKLQHFKLYMDREARGQDPRGRGQGRGNKILAFGIIKISKPIKKCFCQNLNVD